MPLQALRTVTKAQNGVGAFILQCKRIDFHYCDWAGSSRGMNEFLKTKLATFARENPSVQITVSPRPNKHPMLRAHYVNGRERTICARKMTTHEVHEKALILRNASGDKVKKIKDKVISQNESVRGVWDAYHGAQFKI